MDGCNAVVAGLCDLVVVMLGCSDVVVVVDCCDLVNVLIGCNDVVVVVGV